MEKEKLKTWKDVYRLPLKTSDHHWVYDSDRNFVFEFMTGDENTQQAIVDRINGAKNWLDGFSNLKYDKGYIQKPTGLRIIQIRGWGYLTGIGGLNLSNKEASNIQDTFAQFIISKLNP